LDICNEESLGFFKKIAYTDKLKEVHDSYMAAFGNKYILLTLIGLLREICEVENEKFKMWGIYAGVVQSIMNWQYFEKEDQFKSYIEAQSKHYSIFNNPLPEYFL
jgi:hypothetical protein